MRTFILGFTVVAALTSASAAEYAPLDCSKANAPSLFAICNNYSLGQVEARMATLYGVAASLVAMGQRGDLIDTQREWLAERDRCGDDTGCLHDAVHSSHSATQRGYRRYRIPRSILSISAGGRLSRVCRFARRHLPRRRSRGAGRRVEPCSPLPFCLSRHSQPDQRMDGEIEPFFFAVGR